MRQKQEVIPFEGGELIVPDNQSIAARPEFYLPKTQALRPRNPEHSRNVLVREAKLAGLAFFYGWAVKGDDGEKQIEGASIGCAMAALRCWGNVAQLMMPVQEVRDAWVFTAQIIDLETGFTCERQFRQSKNWAVAGRHDAARKEDIRFQIGQSKAIRNAALNYLPDWYIDAAVDAAKAGVRSNIEELVEKKGIVHAIDLAIGALGRAGVSAESVLARLGYADVRAITIDDVVRLKADFEAIKSGQERAADLFPPVNAEPTAPKSRGLGDVAGNPEPPKSEPKPEPKSEPHSGPSADELDRQVKAKQEAAASERRQEEPPFDPNGDGIIATYTEQINNATTEGGVRKTLERIAKAGVSKSQMDELEMRASLRMDALRNSK